MSDQTITAPTTQADGWHDVCPVTEIPANGGKYVAVQKHSLAVFRVGEGVSVIDDTCPHAGGSLASGFTKDGCVYCPWHGWPFKIENGECPDNSNIKVRKYEARVVSDRVQVKL